MKFYFISIILIQCSICFSQNNDSEKSNIQAFTPSKLLKDQNWDIKVFNSLYTQNKREDNGDIVSEPRSNFFTSTLELFTGISKKANVNMGFILNFKSNTINENFLSPLKFLDDKITSRKSISNIGLSLKWKPFEELSTFSIQTSFYMPMFLDQPRFFLDKRSYVFENRFFYDKMFGANKYQLFTEIDFAYNFGDKASEATVYQNVGERYANNSLGIPISVFLSYFPSSNFTVYLNTQHFELFDLGNNFAQSYTLLGLGTKYQLTRELNIELSYTKFILARGAGLGQTFNFGLRYLII
jgi:hypothetical protein